MDKIYLFSWQCFLDKRGEKSLWITDIHGFHSFDDALNVGIDTHTKCTRHKMHRIVMLTYNKETLDRIAAVPVFYLLPNKVEEGLANA